MNNKFINTIAVIALSVFGLAARENIGTGSGKTTVNYKGLAAVCNPATSQIELSINNVRTILLNGGDMWWNLTDARYEIPKVDPSTGAAPAHSLFAGAIWMGGIDETGQLKIAAQTYRQSGNDFWPGPLDDNASVDRTVCDEYDKFWEVRGTTIDSFLAAIALTGGGCLSESDVPRSILEWPARGNTRATGASGTFLNITEEMAPFMDANHNGYYDPECGDYPVINPECGDGNTYGDQMIFWVYNDRGDIHTETGGVPIGIQVNALAFAFATSDEVNDMTFYRYKIINKAPTSPIRDFYMAQWVDADLGCYDNDYVGCDTVRGLGICYNGESTDPDCASKGYGNDPPLVGVDFFEGPLSDPFLQIVGGDTLGFIRKQLGMSAFTYYNNDFSTIGNPETAVHFYNYMTGKWKDNTCFTSDECNAYGGTQCTRFMFPSSAELSPFPAYWSECSCNNPAFDRRFLQSSGPFTLQPGAVNNITIGVVWVRPSGVYPCPKFTYIASADDKAQALFDNCFKLVDGPDAPTLAIRELDKELIIALVNLPGSNNINESYDEVDPIARAYWETHPSATDTTYKFQGYKLYQLKNEQISVQELGDVNKARLIAQVDLKDDVDKIINFTFDQTLGASVPALMVDGNNEGIRKTFRILVDQFATESNTLVNHKTYYFAAIAYAHNSYVPYDIGTGEGQGTPYIQGRRNFVKYSAIPHISDPPRGGTILQSQYGDGVKITRLDGTGNGGWNLDLTDSSTNEILKNNFVANIEYDTGRGPIGVKVYDPMKVKKAYFKLSMMDSVTIDTLSVRGTIDTTYISPQAYWELEVTNIEDGNTEIIQAEKDIENINEQLITNYGISIQIGHVGLAGKAPDDWPQQSITDIRTGYIAANGFIEGSVEFEDPEDRWFTGVHDAGTADATNWIRAGQYAEQIPSESNPNPNYQEGFYDDHLYREFGNRGGDVVFYDPNEIFEKVVEGTWTPYGLAANWVNKALTNSYDPPRTNTPYTYGPAFPWRFKKRYFPGYGPFQITENCLHNLQSVDVVLTDNPDLWTRCVVVELGEDTTLTEGFAMKGNIRMHYVNSPAGLRPSSWNKDGTYTTADTGRSWFPGYAINVETGERLNLMFGEDSWLIGENGRDLVWNPTSTEKSPVGNSEPLFGGKHYIYVMNTRYDEGRAIQRDMISNFNKTVIDLNVPPSNPILISPLNDLVYRKIMWVSMSLLQKGFKLDALPPAGNIVPSDVKVRLRVNAPYRRYMDPNEWNVGSNKSLPQYAFTTDGMEARTEQVEVAKTACDMIRVVPNPYYAYSAYETGQRDNRVKITNLPDNCTVTIYTLGGTLIRQFDRDISSDVSDGFNTEADEGSNLDSSIDWDLKNNKNIPVASGVYLIHVVKDGVCEKVVKWFGVLRPFDSDTF